MAGGLWVAYVFGVEGDAVAKGRPFGVDDVVEGVAVFGYIHVGGDFGHKSAQAAVEAYVAAATCDGVGAIRPQSTISRNISSIVFISVQRYTLHLILSRRKPLNCG